MYYYGTFTSHSSAECTVCRYTPILLDLSVKHNPKSSPLRNIWLKLTEKYFVSSLQTSSYSQPIYVPHSIFLHTTDHQTQ